MRHLDLLQRFPSKIIGMKELDSEVAGGSEDSQQIQPKSKTQLSRTVRLVSEQPSGLLTHEIGKDVLFGCESTNSRTGRPVNGPPFSQSCVPVSVERVDKDKDADENVDADQTRTGRPASGQPAGLFTQLQEIDIDFRVSGLPHAVVKQAENFRVAKGQCRVVRVMRNNSESAMFSMSSLLESRSDLLHLRTPLG